MKKIYFVIPCYNEEEVIMETSSRLTKKLDSLIKAGLVDVRSKMVFVDDGSKDKTWELIEKLHKNSKYVKGIKLSRNRGHQNALLAGLMTCKDECDAIVSLDADLQDDIDVIDKFIIDFNNGSDIVYGVRKERKTDTFFKRQTALMFYRMMKGLGVDIVYNHADYRLLSKRALDYLSDYKEVNLFLRGIIPLIGFKSSKVEYDRNVRFAGESKYPLKKMLSFAFDGITSFSVKPIRLIFSLGIFITILSLLILIYSIIVKFVGQAVSGWTFIVCSIWMIGGIQMLSLGVIGEYIGKIYSETKARPRYIVETIL